MVGPPADAGAGGARRAARWRAAGVGAASSPSRPRLLCQATLVRSGGALAGGGLAPWSGGRRRGGAALAVGAALAGGAAGRCGHGGGAVRRALAAARAARVAGGANATGGVGGPSTRPVRPHTRLSPETLGAAARRPWDGGEQIATRGGLERWSVPIL